MIQILDAMPFNFNFKSKYRVLIVTGIANLQNLQNLFGTQ